MSCRCPIQPDYCVDQPITELDCAACPNCVLRLDEHALRRVLAQRSALIERLHATRSTLMEERGNALDQRNEARFLEMLGCTVHRGIYDGDEPWCDRAITWGAGATPSAEPEVDHRPCVLRPLFYEEAPKP